MKKVLNLFRSRNMLHLGLFEFPPGILNTYYGRTPSTNRLLFHRPFACINYHIILLFPIQSLHATPYQLIMLNNQPILFSSKTTVHFLTLHKLVVVFSGTQTSYASNFCMEVLLQNMIGCLTTVWLPWLQTS